MTTLPAVVAAVASPLASARVAAWTWSEARRLPEPLARDGIRAIGLIQPPPPAADRQRRTVCTVLRLAGATCLVRSAVLQRWDADHAAGRPLVVGVARDREGGIVAHAWLDGEADGTEFIELHRRDPG